VFGAILDADKGGRFRIAPAAGGELRRKQYYWPETNVLITRFLHPDGIAEVEDYMPVGSGAGPDAQLVRRVRVMFTGRPRAGKPAWPTEQDGHAATEFRRSFFRVPLFAVHSRLHPPGHDELGDEQLDDFAQLVAGLAADGGHAAVRPRSRRPQFEDFALDVKHRARPQRTGPRDLSSGAHDAAGDGEAAH
jgi:hypothetical protein